MSESKMNKQAFLIGINQYAALPELKYARQDAEAVEQALKQNYSFSENEVMLMTDAKPGLFKPFNKRVIQMHLENLANQELDLFIFGFWGHGLFRNGERYLCPLDVMNVDVEESGFSFKELQRLLSKIRAKNTCMILDCCQTIHDSRGETETLTATDQKNMENAARDIVLRRKEQYPEFVSNVAILNSCKKGQRSYEWDKRQHGIFTAHLLDAMNQRYESVAKIIGYISNNVEKTAMELGKTQTPFYKLEGDIPLPVNRVSMPIILGNVSSVVSPPQPKTESKESHNPIADFLKSERQKKQERLQNEAIKALETFKNEEYWKTISKLEEILKQEPNDKDAKDLLAICEQKIDELYLTGNRYFEGDGVAKDIAEAVKWFCRAAEQGHAGAQYMLGDCYYGGLGVPEDKAEAVKWYRKAAEQGNEWAQEKLGDCYYGGLGVPEDNAEAVKWYRKAAEQGNEWVQRKLGDCYYGGLGVPEDKAEAVKWYRKAAEQGDVKAQFKLGICYDNGKGVSKDAKEAVKWYHKAAEQGNAEAQCNLASCYYYGSGVAKNKTEAVKWYRKAAEQGNIWAQYCLGNCYFMGDGVPKDNSEAKKWYRKAAERGNKAAKEQLDKLEGFWYQLFNH